MFEMKILKMAHYTFFIIFHLKVSVYQISNLTHIYDHRPKKNPFVIMIKLFKWFTNLFQSYGLIMFTTFIKIKNHFNHFLNIFSFSNTL
jgi:hypothetical protein